MIKKICLLAVVLNSTLITVAQTTPSDSIISTIDKIDIVKKYQYAIKKVKKLDVHPEFSDTNFITTNFDYELPLIGNRETKPLISPIKNSFFSLNSDAKKHLMYSNYVIGAFSSESNPFAEISFAEELDNFKFGLFGQYHADNQTDNQEPFFGFEHARIDGYLDYLRKKLLFQTEAGFQFQEERLIFEDGPNFTHQNVSYNKYNVKIGLENLSKRSFIKQAHLAFKGINQKNKNTESYLNFNVNFSDYLLQEALLWKVDVNYHLSVNEMDSNALDNNLSVLDIKPQIQGSKDKFFYKAGLNIINAWDDNHIGGPANTYLIPELNLSYRFDKSYNLSAGLTSDYELYTYRQIVNNNPFIAEGGVDTRARVSKLFYANLDGIVKGVKYRMGAKYALGGNWLFFETLPINSHTYRPYYKSGDYMSLNLNLDYKFTKQLNFNLDILLQQYNLEGGVKASHTPALISHFKTSYQIDDQWATYGTLKYSTKQNMISNTSFADPDQRGIQKEVNPIFDISIGMQYDIRRQWRIFAEINNLLNQKYETWGTYRHKGIYFTGGFRFKF